MPNENTNIVLDFKPDGKRGVGTLTASLGNEALHVDQLDIRKETDRARFVKTVVDKYPGIDAEAAKALDGELLQLAGKTTGRSDGKDDRRSSSTASALVGLAESADLFHTPGGYESQAYATIKVGSHRETLAVGSNAYKRQLSYAFYAVTRMAPSSEAVGEAVSTLTGKALFEGIERPVYVRVAGCDGAIYLDLCDHGWRAVRIDATGWEVLDSDGLPVRFIRKNGMLPLPEPVKGGNIQTLRAFVNVPDDRDWALLVGWLVAAFRPIGPYPVLCVNGEQGSAKSTLSRIVRALVDPNASPLRRPPRDDRDLLIAATNGHVIALDNLSGIKPALSDALCTVATGGGFATRQLYSDGEEKLFTATRPILLNGIDDLATRPDLLDRAVTLTLPTIQDADRKLEANLLREFEANRPAILGALLDAVSAAIGRVDSIHLVDSPRMADFATWVVAAETASGLKPGAFMAAYTRNRGAAHHLAIEASAIGSAILGLIHSRGGLLWEGVAKELLTEISADRHSDEATRKRRGWPKTPRKLSGELRRIAPNLRSLGVYVTFPGHTRQGSIIAIVGGGETPSQPSHRHGTALPGPPTPFVRDESVTVGDGCDGVMKPQSSRQNPAADTENGVGDDGDGRDGQTRFPMDVSSNVQRFIDEY